MKLYFYLFNRTGYGEKYFKIIKVCDYGGIVEVFMTV